MDMLHALAEKGAEAGTAVLAGEQLAGRGSRGRFWHSPPGGLWLSVLFRPPAIGGLEVVSLRAGLAVAESLNPMIDEAIRLKWPNDLMLGERKVGGILCEARWQGHALSWVAVGVGLNIQNSVPQAVSESATWLALGYPGISAERVCDLVVGALRRLDLRPRELTQEERNRFAQRDWLYGRDIRAPLAGRAAGLSPDGALLIRQTDHSAALLRSGSIELAAITSDR
jgi:BirA family biotin operon repressor/biotin-[acetyl-CoA-carboxylase] ligase